MLGDVRDLVQRYGDDDARVYGETSTNISDAQIADTRKNTLESNLSVLLTPAMD
jgi:hypothetical protein